MRPIDIQAMAVTLAVLIGASRVACSASEDALASEPLRLSEENQSAASSAQPAIDPRWSIEPAATAPRIRWWTIDPLPYEVRQRALHPDRHLIGFQDSPWMAEPVPLTTRAMNDLRITGDPHTWLLLSLGYRLMF